MTIHSDIFAAAFGTLLDTQGEVATVTPKGGVAVEVSAIVGLEELKVRWIGSKRLQVRQRTFSFTTNEASRFGGVAALERNAKLTYGDLDYAVLEIEGEGDGMIVVCAYRSAREVQGEYYRGQ